MLNLYKRKFDSFKIIIKKAEDWVTLNKIMCLESHCNGSVKFEFNNHSIRKTIPSKTFYQPIILLSNLYNINWD